MARRQKDTPKNMDNGQHRTAEEAFELAHKVAETCFPVKNSFVRLGRRGQSVMYEPAVFTDKCRIAILVMHSDADYLSFSTGGEMARRGYRVLCANVSDKELDLDSKMMDVRLAVEFLREYPGVQKIVLMGHSGGGTLMTAYQSIAENGVKVFQGAEKIHRCSDELANLPYADGLMLLDSNWGNAVMSLFSLDPAVMEEGNGRWIEPSLNLFSPANGFDPNGSSYDEDFIRRFQKAQGERNNRLIDMALERLRHLESGCGRYADDEPFIVTGAAQVFMNNKLYAQDIRLMSRTRNAWPLLRADGGMTIEVVHSVRKPQNPLSYTDSLHVGALRTSVRRFLSSYAIRTTKEFGYDTDTIRGLDWSSSYSCPPGNIRSISAPLLVMGMTGGWEYLASETIYENSNSMDKTIVFVEGAGHLFTTVKECESHPGQFGDTMKTTCDFVDKWLSQSGRFA